MNFNTFRDDFRQFTIVARKANGKLEDHRVEFIKDATSEHFIHCSLAEKSIVLQPIVAPKAKPASSRILAAVARKEPGHLSLDAFSQQLLSQDEPPAEIAPPSILCACRDRCLHVPMLSERLRKSSRAQIL